MALDAVVASTPTASLVAAFGLAGGGYLTGREDVAACGAVAGAFGLVVERLQTRSVRVRLRRERARHRGDLQDVSRLLHDVQRDLAALRADLDDVRAERDAVRDQLRGTLDELTAVRGVPSAAATSAAPAAPALSATLTVPGDPTASAAGPVGVGAVGSAGGTAAEPEAATAPVMAIVEEPVLAEPVVRSRPVPLSTAIGSGVPVGSAGPIDAGAELPPRVPLTLMVPGQVRSPIATGGIPILAPGPSEPVRVVDLRVVRADLGAQTQPIPVRATELVDALVYAAIAEADAAELSRALEFPDDLAGRHAGPLHTGDAHHAGDYARDQLVAVGGGSPAIVVVRRGKHVA